MSDAFERAVSFVLDHEGGYSDDPADPGGETNYGISKRAYPLIDIKALTRAGATQIYLEDYWDGPGLDRLPPKVGICVFDAGVNMGIRTAIRQLQQELAITADGVIGNLTAEVAGLRNVRGLVAGIGTRRIMRYSTLATWPRFGMGWVRRVLDCQALALTL